MLEIERPRTGLNYVLGRGTDVTPAPAVLIVDDDASMRQTMSLIVEQNGMRALTAETGEEALEMCRKKPADLMLLDMRLPGKSGLEVLAELKRRHAEVGVIMFSVVKETDTVVEAIRLGALDYVVKDFGPTELLVRIVKAIHQLRAKKELSRLRAESVTRVKRPMILGPSPAMAEVLALARRVAATPTTVLISGESGSGKEVLARYLHEQSDRHAGPFVPIDLAALAPGFVESTLFGRDEGERITPGRFELAEGGTVFLDEVADLSLEVQAKILRVVESREIDRVGSARCIPLNIRIVCATRQDLRALVEQGSFREDLYYRLNVQPIALPPLRQRLEDLGPFAAGFLADFAQRYRRPTKSLSEAALAALKKHGWRGNVRELQNLMERFVINSDEAVVELHAMPEEFQQPQVPPAQEREPTLAEAVSAFEREQISKALRLASGDKRQAATLLGIGYSTLRKKLSELGIAKEEDWN